MDESTNDPIRTARERFLAARLSMSCSFERPLASRFLLEGTRMAVCSRL
jgi:hypothetical protein